MDDANAQVDITFHVNLGPGARVGQVKVDGDTGMTLEQFRKKAKLKAESKVNRDTTNRALEGLRKELPEAAAAGVECQSEVEGVPAAYQSSELFLRRRPGTDCDGGSRRRETEQAPDQEADSGL